MNINFRSFYICNLVKAPNRSTQFPVHDDTVTSIFTNIHRGMEEWSKENSSFHYFECTMYVCAKEFIICTPENKNTIFSKGSSQKGANAWRKKIVYRVDHSCAINVYTNMQRNYLLRIPVHSALNRKMYYFSHLCFSPIFVYKIRGTWYKSRSYFPLDSCSFNVYSFFVVSYFTTLRFYSQNGTVNGICVGI